MKDQDVQSITTESPTEEESSKTSTISKIVDNSESIKNSSIFGENTSNINKLNKMNKLKAKITDAILNLRNQIGNELKKISDLEEQKKYFNGQHGYYKKYGIFQIDEKIQKCENNLNILREDLKRQEDRRQELELL
ncbi:hypothetical protein BCR32DRAFT_263885 [Anaeromyces robustus]|uniref:Uncharacterized protein n=1 Tax=Anaeromyces robustus TaxID=1754192 RepID=A0A1Y1XQJ9_9FUNG|nr:hypothetical protein BCR32DRAFT_263885 [Anaeromyces robustus]|eukprot:ORX88018.1 hypothetical protein BCR32DRAFT_263885 [Anaeromyces robustus]